MGSIRVLPICLLAVILFQAHLSTALTIPEPTDGEVKSEPKKEATEEKTEVEGLKLQEVKEEDSGFVDLDDFVLPEISVNVKVSLPRKRSRQSKSNGSKPEGHLVEYFEEVPEETKEEAEPLKNGNDKSVENKTTISGEESEVKLATREPSAVKTQGSATL